MSAMASQITSLTIVYSQIKGASNLRVTGLCEGNSPVTGEFPAQRASNAEMFQFDDVIVACECAMLEYEWYFYFLVGSPTASF